MLAGGLAAACGCEVMVGTGLCRDARRHTKDTEDALCVLLPAWLDADRGDEAGDGEHYLVRAE